MEYLSPWQDGFTLEPLLFWLCWPINSLVFHSLPCPSIHFGAPAISLAFVFLLYLVFSSITCLREWAWPVLPSPQTCNTNNPQARGRHWPFTSSLALDGLAHQAVGSVLAAFLTTSRYTCHFCPVGRAVFLSSGITPPFSRTDPTQQACPVLDF